MTNEHTSGPWRYERGNPWASMPEYGRWEVIGDGGEKIPVAGCVTKTDARLIAAAPDMLKALQRLTHPMADDDDLQFALETIAKAKGQA